MPITAKQKELRINHLGSSDMAAVLGVDPFRTAYDVYLEKTGQVDELVETEEMYAGKMFEDGVLCFAENKLGKLIRNQYRTAEGFPIGSNIDAIVHESGEPVESKTAGLFGPLMEEWGPDGTDELPDRIIIQCHVHLLCTDKEICHVPAFIGGRGFQLFRIIRDKEIMDIIMDKSIEFWTDYVEAKCPPPDVLPSIEMAKRIKREPEKVVDIETQIVQNWLNSKESLKISENIKEAAEAELLAALGTAEAGRCDLGLLTYYEQSRRDIDSKKLREEQPDIAAKYVRESKYRVARLKKPTKEKFIKGLTNG